jgi:hypothetical protein
MIDEVVVFAQVSAIIVLLVGSLATIGVATTHAVRRATRRELPTRESDERLEQLQQSVDAIAIEVERIAEAQRFTAKLLSERVDTTQVGQSPTQVEVAWTNAMPPAADRTGRT